MPLSAILVSAFFLLPHALASPPSGLPVERTNYGLDYWREAEGLPQSRIRAIAQTHDGYLWLGTDNGLVRFNGTGFTAFTVETGSLKDNEVWSLQEDNEFALWIGTYGGGLTRMKDGHFHTYTTAEGLPDDVITRIVKDSSGNIWLSTPSGISRYSHGTFANFGSMDGSNFGPLCASSADSVFVAGPSRLLRFNGNHFTPVEGIVTERDGAIEQLVCASDGALWIGFSDAVIKRWKNGLVTTFNHGPNHTPQVTLLYEDPAGGIWTAFGQTLLKFKDNRFEPVLFEDPKTNLGVVYSLHADREGSIWAGLQSSGLARLRKKQLATLTTSDGLPNDSTRSVFETKSGDVLVGTASGFVLYRNGRATAFPLLEGRRLGPVRSFAEDASGKLWIAEGKNLLTLEAGRLIYNKAWKGVSEIEVIFRDAKGKMWVGSDGDGLFQFENNSFTNLRDRNGLAGNRIRAIFEDSHGAMWISAFGAGVSRWANGKFTNYGTSSGLAANRVSAIHEDEEGAIWFTSRAGITRLKEGKFFTYNSASGLPVNFVYNLLDDGKGNFWFGSAQGLIKVSKSSLRAYAAGTIKRIVAETYGLRDGMRTRACNVGNQPAVWKTKAGTLLFSSMRGLVVVEPSRLEKSDFVPPVEVESATINKAAQQVTQQPTLPLGSGEFEVHYAALSFLAPEKVQFKYLLEGFDTDWVDAGSRRFAYYANLPAGTYRFRVTAGNAGGEWNQKGAVFVFELTPHFYQSKMFLALMLTMVLLLAWLFYRYHMHELKERYSAVLAERNRISQDIHDTFAQNLAGIALQLDSMTMQLQEIPQGLREQIDTACRLTRYSLAEARRAVTDLRSDELDRADLTLALPEIAQRLALNSPVHTSVQVTGTPHRLSPVTEKNLLRIFQEAMANALKHAQASNIEIELKYGSSQLALRVADDGGGFDAGREIPLGIGHYGLTGMRERTERIGGSFSLKSAPGQGTELLITVPFSA